MSKTYIDYLLERAISTGLLAVRDEVYVRNKLAALFPLQDDGVEMKCLPEDNLPGILEKMGNQAVADGMIDNALAAKEVWKANVMDAFIGLPSMVEDTFYEKYARSPEEATDYFYGLSQLTNYIQTEEMKKNVHFQTETMYGTLDITINVAKEEKVAKQIKRDEIVEDKMGGHPACPLCIENEGYEGGKGRTARANHRMIGVELDGESWYFQYSPYQYFNEHSILLSEQHRDMKISRNGFARLFDFVEQFPHYFIGSNADLPIVGGSILGHDHYQAGNYSFAMERAVPLFTFDLPNYPEVAASVLKWPLSVIRLQGKDKQQLVQVTHVIFETWENYADKAVDIIPYSGDERHHTVTPIVRKKADVFEIDIVLRNNRTSEEFPDGIFHPHGDLQHIKQENIGLIEVMGLAVLPGRLKDELVEVKKYIIGEASNVAAYHVSWAEELKGKYRESMDLPSFIEKELGEKFVQILEDAGVYKQDVQGIMHMKKFIKRIKEAV